MDLIEVGDYPHINAAGLADFYLIGNNRARFIFYDWHKIDGVFRRVVVGMVTRQIEKFPEEHLAIIAAFSDKAIMIGH